MTRHVPLLLSFALGIAVAGCGDDDGGDGALDSGPGIDAGARVDAGSGSDAGSDSDAGADSDAGSGTDAGGDSDAGSDSDAGADTDAGADSDAGSTGTGADTCALALDVSAGATLTGQSTMAASDDYMPIGAGCPAGGVASGRDVAYALSPAATTSYRVRVTPTTPSFDPMLYAVSTCGNPGCVAGTVLNGPGEIEEITLTVDGGETVYVIVDGELASRGDFDLSVVIE